ncbi:hypothetical protein AZE42_07796 [Rhizopogon vesiculosus]|uniref:Major facilitator superfamily (MFS) profile domain-containing protein n=1 Tax=Rhizopogon vesiculosus TaxID=180088 RepID=A0A1J8QLT6_9AGAM|nr:hypothetical protein AZE42_07796 [Rhizopogon vesiculosus]
MDIIDTPNLPRAYGYMPIPFRIGQMVGPLVGGTFSQPADRFPEIFGRSELLKTYPYLLPCAVPAIFTAIAWLLTYFRLKESVSTKAPLWELIKEPFLRQSSTKPSTGSLRDAFANSSDEATAEEVASRPLPLRAVLTPKVVSVSASYASMALFYAAITSIVPIFYATPIELGGLSLDPPRIGAILGASSLVQGAFQILFYARLNYRFGARAVHATGILSCIPIVILFPVTNTLARAHGMSLAVWLAICAQHALTVNLIMCFPCMDLFMRAAAPNRASLGTTNGVGQFAVSGARILGPVSAASIFSYSMQEGHDAWSVYYFLMAIVFLAIGASMSLPRDPSLWENNE